MTGPGLDEQIRTLLSELAALGGEDLVEQEDGPAPVERGAGAEVPPVATSPVQDPFEAVLELNLQQISYAAARKAHSRVVPRPLREFLGAL